MNCNLWIMDRDDFLNLNLCPGDANLWLQGLLACWIIWIVAKCLQLNFYCSVPSKVCCVQDSACSGRTVPYRILLDLLFLLDLIKVSYSFYYPLFLLQRKSLVGSDWFPLRISPHCFHVAGALADRNVAPWAHSNNSSFQQTNSHQPLYSLTLCPMFSALFIN